MILSSPLILSERSLVRVHARRLECHAFYHRESRWYKQEQYLPYGYYGYVGTSWCISCWRRYYLMLAGTYLKWTSHAPIEAGVQAWYKFMREATQEMIYQVWCAMDESVRRLVAGLDGVIREG